jgi:hypothetical protein
MQNLDAQRADALLRARGEQLVARGERFELVVIGGSALIALGFVERTTRDIDVVALLTDEGLAPASPLPPALLEARERVAQDFGLLPAWLNTGPADLLRFGLPDGFVDRLAHRDFGIALTVHYAGRLDQIHFKLYAMADDRPGGRHEIDLRALSPTHDELVTAARWARTHDPSPGFRLEIEAALGHLGVEDVDLGP